MLVGKCGLLLGELNKLLNIAAGQHRERGYAVRWVAPRRHSAPCKINPIRCLRERDSRIHQREYIRCCPGPVSNAPFRHQSRYRAPISSRSTVCARDQALRQPGGHPNRPTVAVTGSKSSKNALNPISPAQHYVPYLPDSSKPVDKRKSKGRCVWFLSNSRAVHLPCTGARLKTWDHACRGHSRGTSDSPPASR